MSSTNWKPISHGGRRADGGDDFDLRWFEANGLGSAAPMNRVLLEDRSGVDGKSRDSKENKGEGKPAGGQQFEQLQELRKSLGQRQNLAIDGVAPRNEAVQDMSPGKEAAANSQFAGGKGKRASRVIDVENEVRLRYQQQLDSQQMQAPSQAAQNPFANGIAVPQSTGATNMPVMPGMTGMPGMQGVPGVPGMGGMPGMPARPGEPSMAGRLGSRPAADLPVAKPEPASAEDAGILTSLDVDLPAGGREYLFRTPRGELEIKGYAVSRPLWERLWRLGTLIVVVAVVGGPWLWASRRLAARRSAAVRVNS